ncbi:MAG: hypothetical protein LAP40_01170 [Acidobacteriia bacterium]|nr:hypothetical protein [Terriglobia bacterium]
MSQRSILTAFSFVIASLPLAAAPHPCDRACMTALVDQYLAALVKHDPAGLPLARGVRSTENTAEITIGDGLWVGASEAPTTFKIYAVDSATRQVAFYGVMKEWDKPLIIALRLKVIEGQITEIEHVLARNLRPDRMQNLTTPRPGLLADVPASERTSREDMIDAAYLYFESIEQRRGSVAPFAEDCERHENGGQTTHNKTPLPWPVDLGSPEANRSMAILGTLTCKAQVDSQVLSFITRLWPRRLDVVDEQKSSVFAFPMFQHRGGVRRIKILGVPGVDTIPMGGGTSNLQAGEIFKIRGGQIHEIEATGVSLPYGTKSGW